jgi:hypothetical protein
VSVDSTGHQANGDGLSPAISADGSYVAFISTANNLVFGDNNAAADVFVSTANTPTPTPTRTRTPTPTPTPRSCIGDCNGDGQVTINEILTLVNIALDNGGSCTDGAPSGADVDVALMLRAVNNALNGCGD